MGGVGASVEVVRWGAVGLVLIVGALRARAWGVAACILSTGFCLLAGRRMVSHSFLAVSMAWLLRWLRMFSAWCLCIVCFTPGPLRGFSRFLGTCGSFGFYCDACLCGGLWRLLGPALALRALWAVPVSFFFFFCRVGVSPCRTGARCCPNGV